ncbi:uncharacterized protein LOC122856335 [Aphidius gifuensis]|uniref:uncharacterized protein LOC122856335 n=1 Tax=Aphidius gifuensis TaxID=684658 RepID=UPI001CDD1515|nr:uncharacterized protein LOC122856335 [Aphidius gifuensis]
MMDKLITIEQKLLMNNIRQPSSRQALFLKNLYCNTLEEFDILDARLEVQDFNKQMQENIVKFVNPSMTIQRNISDVLKQILSKDVLSKFTAQKATKDKSRIFLETKMWQCIENVLNQEWEADRLPIPKSRELSQDLGAAMNSSRDWGKKRRKINTIHVDGNGTAVQQLENIDNI